jgi:NADPH:quinone reductase-like Zn-dependent oxidoreductase
MKSVSTHLSGIILTTHLQIGDYSFEEAASLATMYGPASALFLHLGLERPTNPPKNPEKKERVLVWGASSSFGGLAAQLASKSGYIVVGVASARNEELAKSLGVSLFVDRASETVTEDLISLGPFKAILAASESGEDQVKIGSILTAHGGGHFVTTMGVRREVNLPKGVTASFHQFLDDFLDPANSEFTEWFWWNYLEDSFVQNQLKSLPVEVYGGLSSTKRAWDVLREGKISGKRMIIRPDVDQ